MWWHGMSPFMIVMSGLAGVFIILIAQFALTPFFSAKRFSAEALIWISLGVIAIGLTIAVPQIVWAPGSPITKVQLPFRYIGIMEFIALSLALCALRDIGTRRLVWQRLLAVEGVILIIGSMAGFIALVFWDQTYELEEHTKRKRDTLWLANEYLPNSITGDYDSTNAIAVRIQKDKTPLLRMASEDDRLRLIDQSGPELIIETTAQSQTTLYLRQFAFPGWRAVNTRDGVQLNLTTTGEFGTIAITVPAGSTRVRIYRENLPAEWQGLALFIFGGVLLLAGSAVHFGWVA
jgi:hypothetical protein